MLAAEYDEVLQSGTRGFGSNKNIIALTFAGGSL
jgi:hypothetical protein